MIRLPSPSLRRLAACWLLSLLASTGAAAALQSPEIVVREIFAQLLTELDARRNGDTLAPESARQVFDELLSPRIDYQALAHWILREYWLNATAEQQKAFLSAFENYIINTYALALSNGADVSLEVEDDPSLRNSAALVNAKFSLSGSTPVPLQFRLIARDEQWKLFDVSFAGVSLAVTFRSDFNYVAREGGIDAVTAHLQQRVGG